MAQEGRFRRREQPERRETRGAGGPEPQAKGCGLLRTTGWHDHEQHHSMGRPEDPRTATAGSSHVRRKLL